MPSLIARAGQGMWRRRWVYGLGAALVLGILFRLIFPADIEYKGDEAWTAAQVGGFLAGGAAPALGMRSSAGLPNAGLSLWIFLALGRLLGSADPVVLARAVAVLASAALVLLVLFALRLVPRSEREPWLWSAALVAVNPLEVLLQRKLWPPSVFPLFTLAFLCGWRRRGCVWGAFLWGLAGALLGQIEFGGFFFAVAFVLAVLIVDRRSVRWRAWLAGSLLGTLALLPWAAAVLAGGPTMTGALFPRARFFLDWFQLALGSDIGYSLGRNLRDFLAGPVVAGVPSHGAAALTALALALFLALVLRLVWRLVAVPRRAAGEFLATRSPTVLTLAAGFLGYGLLLTATLRPVYPHYLLVAFALPALSLAWLARVGSRDDFRSLAWSRRLLATLVVAQALLSADLLAYIHTTRVIAGDYGTVYAAQPRARPR